MLMTKVAALVLGIGMFIVALSIVTYDLVTAYRYREALPSGAAGQEQGKLFGCRCVRDRLMLPSTKARRGTDAAA